MAAALISDADIQAVLKQVYGSYRRSIWPVAFPYRYRADAGEYCWKCGGITIEEADREPHEMWHRLKEAP